RQTEQGTGELPVTTPLTKAKVVRVVLANWSGIRPGVSRWRLRSVRLLRPVPARAPIAFLRAHRLPLDGRGAIDETIAQALRRRGVTARVLRPDLVSSTVH